MTAAAVAPVQNRAPVATGTGRLRNGNPPGDLRLALRCGARTRVGLACGQPAMKNTRCRLHGGRSTGPRTVDGLARSRRARWVHGGRGRAYVEMRRDGMELRRRINGLCAEIAARIALDAGGPGQNKPIPWSPVGGIWKGSPVGGIGKVEPQRTQRTQSFTEKNKNSSAPAK